MTASEKYKKRTITCARCGKEIYYKEAYPTQNTQVRPKPKLTERRKYCKSCWHIITHEETLRLQNAKRSKAHLKIYEEVMRKEADEKRRKMEEAEAAKMASE